MMEKHARDTYQTIKVAVWIPLLQAAASGLILGAAAAALLYLVEISAVLVLSLFIAALVASVAWISGLRFWREMVSSVDGKVERIPLYSQVEPEQLSEPVSMRVELIQDDGRAGSYITLPASPGKLRALARGLLSGKSFTEGAWCGSGGIFSRGEFVQLREEMKKRKLIELNSPSTAARGYSLTNGGKACIRYLAESSTPPLLRSGDDIGGF